MSYVKKNPDKLVEPVGGGSHRIGLLSTGPTPSSYFVIRGSTWDFFQPKEPLGSIIVNIYSMKV